MKYLFLIITISFILIGCGGNTEEATSAKSGSELINMEYQTFRDTAFKTMENLINTAGLQIYKEDIAVAISPSFQSGIDVFINAGISGIENLSLDELAQGKRVMASLVLLGISESEGSLISKSGGFYTVEIYQEAGQWFFRLKDLSSAEIFRGEAKVTETKQQATSADVGIKTTPDELCSIINGNSIRIEVCLTRDTISQILINRPKESDVILEQAVVVSREILKVLSSETGKSPLAVPLISGNGNKFIASVYNPDMEVTNFEELTKGKEVLYIYIYGTQLPNGFYEVFVFRSETGEWIARFKDIKSQKIVLETQAYVTTSSIKTEKPFLSIEYPVYVPKPAFKPTVTAPDGTIIDIILY